MRGFRLGKRVCPGSKELGEMGKSRVTSLNYMSEIEVGGMYTEG